MTLKINENNIIKIARLDYDITDVCIDWVSRNLYLSCTTLGYFYVVKFDITMWENGIIKFDEIFKAKISTEDYLSVSPSMGYVYYRSPENIIFY